MEDDSDNRPAKRFKSSLVDLPFVSAYHHIKLIQQHYTGEVCKNQLLHQLTQSKVPYDQPVNTKSITFPIQSTYEHLVKAYPKAICTLSIENQHSVRWFVDLIIEQFSGASQQQQDQQQSQQLQQEVLKVTYNQERLLNNLNPGVLMFATQTAEGVLNSSITYILDNNVLLNTRTLKLRFNYGLSGFAQGILDYVSDLRCVNNMTKLALSLSQIVESQQPNWFRVHTLSHTLISIEYGNDFQFSLSISWSNPNKCYMLVFTPTNELSFNIEDAFNNRFDGDITKLLSVIKACCIPVSFIKSKLSHLWTIIPVAFSQVKMHYLGKFAYSITFAANGTITLVKKDETKSVSTLQEFETEVTRWNKQFSSNTIFELLCNTAISYKKEVVGRRTQISNNTDTIVFNFEQPQGGLADDHKEFALLSDRFTEAEVNGLISLYNQQISFDKGLGPEKIIPAMYAGLTSLIQCGIAMKPVLQCLAFIYNINNTNSEAKSRIELHLAVPQDLKIPRKIAETIKDGWQSQPSCLRCSSDIFVLVCCCLQAILIFNN